MPSQATAAKVSLVLVPCKGGARKKTTPTRLDRTLPETADFAAFQPKPFVQHLERAFGADEAYQSPPSPCVATTTRASLRTTPETPNPSLIQPAHAIKTRIGDPVLFLKKGTNPIV